MKYGRVLSLCLLVPAIDVVQTAGYVQCEICPLDMSEKLDMSTIS